MVFMLDNKMIMICGGCLVVLPAKPILYLAGIGAVTVLSAVYCLYDDSE